MKTLGVVANLEKPLAPEVLRRLGKKARSLGLKLLADAETVRRLPHGRVAEGDGLVEQSDALIALGGDGTMLRAVRVLAGRDRPVLGVNLGSLGFLTSVAAADLERALDCIRANDVILNVASLAEATVMRAGRRIGRHRALNDIVVSRGQSPRVVTLDVSIDNDRGTSCVCDGLIVATPSGSTGHSLSAGGPILSPETRAFVISLICPHTLSSRPLVVPDDSEILITAARCPEGLQLACDGQVGESLSAGDAVKVTRSRRGVRFIHLPGYSYFGVLRHKLHWSGSSLPAAEKR
jgi:NAD+ kinase